MTGQTRIDGNLIDTGTDPNDIVSVSVGDGRYPRLSQDNTLAGNLTVDGQVRSDNVTDSAGSGAPAFPNGMSVTGAALTDPEITGGIYLGGTGSANYLEDYEEGTWTPAVDDLSAISSVTVGSDVTSSVYTKIGDSVRVTFEFSGSVTSGNEVRATFTLPFIAHSTRYTDVGIVPFLVGTGSNRFGNGLLYRGSSSNSKMYLYIPSRQVQYSGNLTGRLTLTYKTDS